MFIMRCSHTLNHAQMLWYSPTHASWTRNSVAYSAATTLRSHVGGSAAIAAFASALCSCRGKTKGQESKGIQGGRAKRRRATLHDVGGCA